MDWLAKEAQATYQRRPFVLFSTIFPLFIGMLLRLPELIIDIRYGKEWSFNWVKVAAVGFPALCVSLSPIWLHTPFGLNLFSLSIGNLGHSTFVTAAGIVFGYVLIDSLKK